MNWIRSQTTENTLPDKNHYKGQRKNLRNPEVPLQHVHNQLTNTFLKIFGIVRRIFTAPFPLFLASAGGSYPAGPIA